MVTFFLLPWKFRFYSIHILFFNYQKTVILFLGLFTFPTTPLICKFILYFKKKKIMNLQQKNKFLEKGINLTKQHTTKLL